MEPLMPAGRPTVPIELSTEERETLRRWARRHSSSQALALRCRIVLACAEGGTNKEIADRLGVNRTTVGKWRNRFAQRRCGGHDLHGLATDRRDRGSHAAAPAGLGRCRART
jgi:hypothetical protein